MAEYQFLRPVEDGQSNAPAAVDLDTGHVFVWVPNTGEWHRSRAMEVEYLAERQPTMRFEEITRAKAAEMVVAAHPIDERVSGWIVEQDRAQPVTERRTHADLMLVLPGRHATRDAVLLNRLQHSRQWIPVKVYRDDQAASAKALASDIRTGRRKSLSPAGELEARTRRVDSLLVVEARRASTAAKAI